MAVATESAAIPELLARPNQPSLPRTLPVHPAPAHPSAPMTRGESFQDMLMGSGKWVLLAIAILILVALLVFLVHRAMTRRKTSTPGGRRNHPTPSPLHQPIQPQAPVQPKPDNPTPEEPKPDPAENKPEEPVVTEEPATPAARENTPEVEDPPLPPMGVLEFEEQLKKQQEAMSGQSDAAVTKPTESAEMNVEPTTPKSVSFQEEVVVMSPSEPPEEGKVRENSVPETNVSTVEQTSVTGSNEETTKTSVPESAVEEKTEVDATQGSAVVDATQGSAVVDATPKSAVEDATDGNNLTPESAVEETTTEIVVEGKNEEVVEVKEEVKPKRRRGRPRKNRNE